MRVTTEEATDWNPVWSPDGTALYFLSNRSGSMNLWRVGIDEATGATTGEAQALAAPASYVRHFSLSADGRLGTYANWATTNNLARIRIDARTAATRGPIEAITSGPRDFLTFDVNDDGQVVLMTNVTQQEDLLIAAAGSGLRHLVNDRYRDRNPRWTADGRQVFFYSDRGQNYELYSIDRGRRRSAPADRYRREAVLPRALTRRLEGAGRRHQRPTSCSSTTPGTSRRHPIAFRPFRRNCGDRASFRSIGRPTVDPCPALSGPNIWVYSFETRAYRRVGARHCARRARFTAQWFPDGRRLLISRQGRVYALDVETGAEREVLAIDGEAIGTARLSPDGTWLYFLHGSASGDIWTVRFDHDAATEARR